MYILFLEKIKPLIVDAVAMMVDEALAAEDMEEEDEDQNAENGRYSKWKKYL